MRAHTHIYGSNHDFLYWLSHILNCWHYDFSPIFLVSFHEAFSSKYVFWFQCLWHECHWTPSGTPLLSSLTRIEYINIIYYATFKLMYESFKFWGTKALNIDMLMRVVCVMQRITGTDGIQEMERMEGEGYGGFPYLNPTWPLQ